MPDPTRPEPAGVGTGAPADQIRRLCSECEEEIRRRPITAEEEQMTRGFGAMPEIGPGLQARISGLRGGGQPLPEASRAFFEPRFGHSFRDIRVHAGESAAAAARALDARAFAVGTDIVFGAGEYSPRSAAGMRLLAHELTHVVQQGGPAPEGVRSIRAAPGISGRYDARQGLSGLGYEPAHPATQRRYSGPPCAGIQRALIAPPTRLDVSSILTSLWETSGVADMDARISQLQVEKGADGNAKLGTVDYDLGPVKNAGNPAHAVALKAALLSVIQGQETGEQYADGEYRVRVKLQADPGPPPVMAKRDFVFAVVRFDRTRNSQVVLSSESSVDVEHRGLVGISDDPAVLQQELKNEYTIEFPSGGVTYKKVNHADKPWSVEDLALIREALAMIGPTEKGLLSGTKFRRLTGANFKGIRGFYLAGSINFFDEALPVGKGTWVGADGREHSYGVHTTLHEIGHLLHFSAAPAAGGQSDYLKLFQDAVWAQAQALHQAQATPGSAQPPLKRVDSVFPPPGIALPTVYSKTGEPWNDFFSDTYSIYRTNPDFLKTPTHGYLLAFFQTQFP